MEKITVSTREWVLYELMHVTCVEEYLALNISFIIPFIIAIQQPMSFHSP